MRRKIKEKSLHFHGTCLLYLNIACHWDKQDSCKRYWSICCNITVVLQLIGHILITSKVWHINLHMWLCLRINKHTLDLHLQSYISARVQFKCRAGCRSLLWHQHAGHVPSLDQTWSLSSQRSSSSREQVPPWGMRRDLTRFHVVQGDGALRPSAICISSGPTPENMNRFPLSFCVHSSAARGYIFYF